MLRKIGAVAAIAAMIVSGAPAKAATYDFTFTGGANDQGVSASGTFTTNDANNSLVFGSGIFSISPVSNQPATLFQATGNTSFYANIFAPTGQSLGVGTSDAWFSAVINGAGYLVGSLGFDGICSNCVADGTLSITAAATPLPATGGMMLLGLGVLGFLGYRRKQTGSVL